jgi:heme exporter protein CcmD
MDHTPFIVAAYAVFAALLLVDALTPLVQRRSLLKRLRSRYLRAARKENP